MNMIYTKLTNYTIEIFCLILLCNISVARADVNFSIKLPATFQGDSSGRLLVFIEPVSDDIELLDQNNIEALASNPQLASVAGKDVEGWDSSKTVLFNADEQAYPAGFSNLENGFYRVQSVLDRNGNYNHAGRGEGDLFSNPQFLTLPLDEPFEITLNQQYPALDVWDFPNSSAADVSRREAVRQSMQEFTLESKLLTTFWGRSTIMKAWVLLPREYEEASDKTWSVVYFSGTFASTHKSNIEIASYIYQLEQAGEIPPLIWVFLDFASPSGPTVFADSVNNGPWGSALVSEFIPALENAYKMDSKASGRFLSGHSSGGWASLWLQMTYPQEFGGAWATAPDPVSFEKFLNVNLYIDNANVFFDSNNVAEPINRYHEKIVATIKNTTQLEEVLGHNGGIFQSFDWVFSPRGSDGKPLSMFNRLNGEINRDVVNYWREHYDISSLLLENWERLGADLKEKFHIYVGTEDSHFLEQAVYILKESLDSLNADADFEFIEGKTHNDLYLRDGDPFALMKEIAQEMYNTAQSSSP